MKMQRFFIWLLPVVLLTTAWLITALPCEQIWFHNHSWCGTDGNSSCAPYNGMCKPSCDGTDYMSCDQMSWCTVIKNASSGAPVCRPNCEAITDSDACWSTRHSQYSPSCWYYNGKCMPACYFYSDNTTFCMNSPYGSYCIWDDSESQCANEYSFAVDPESCNMIGYIYKLVDLGVSWNFNTQQCERACTLQTQLACECDELGSRCQWYPGWAFNNAIGSCLDNCAKGTTKSLCPLMYGCFWLAGSCKRRCENVNVFPTKDDPKKYDTGQCDALDYCGVTVDNKCAFKNCAAATSSEECFEAGYTCVYVAGRCVSSCSANSTFSDIDCPISSANGTTRCEWNSGRCESNCGNFTALGRDACYSIGGYDSDSGLTCMFSQGNCYRACSTYATKSACNLSGVCSYDGSIGCYLSGCDNPEQDDDPVLCAKGQFYKNHSMFPWRQCVYRHGKCYANSCNSAMTKSDCNALDGCLWVNNTFSFLGCVDSPVGMSYDDCWRSNYYQFDTTTCMCEQPCSIWNTAGCSGMCSVDRFGLCANSGSGNGYDPRCSSTAATSAPTAPAVTTPTTSTTPVPLDVSARNIVNDGLSSAEIGAIAGGATFVCCLVLVVFVCVWRRNKSKYRSALHSVDDTPSLLGSARPAHNIAQHGRSSSSSSSASSSSSSSGSNTKPRGKSATSSSAGVAGVVIPANARPIRPRSKSSCANSTASLAEQQQSAPETRHTQLATLADILDVAARQQPMPAPPAAAAASSSPPFSQVRVLDSLRDNATLRSKLRHWDSILDGSALVADASFKEQSLNPSKFDTLQTLTQDECFAIALYTFENTQHGATRDDQFYYFLNNCHFRQRDPEVGAALAPFLAAFASAFAKLPPQHGAVYRGIAVASVEDQNKIRQQYSLGAQIRWHGLTSVSTDETVATNFELSGGGAGICFRIAAVDCRSVAAFSAVPSEDELLLAPGSAFVVVPPEKGFVQKNEKSHTIFLQQLGSQTVAY